MYFFKFKANVNLPMADTVNKASIILFLDASACSEPTAVPPPINRVMADCGFFSLSSFSSSVKESGTFCGFNLDTTNFGSRKYDVNRAGSSYPNCFNSSTDLRFAFNYVKEKFKDDGLFWKGSVDVSSVHLQKTTTWHQKKENLTFTVLPVRYK